MANSTKTQCCAVKTKLLPTLGVGLASGLLTLIDPAKMRSSTRTTLCIATGTLVGGSIWFGTGQDPDTKHNIKLRSGMTLLLSALGYASTKMGFALDAKIHQGLVKRGITNPRTLMAVGAAILTVGSYLLEPQSTEEPAVALKEPTESGTPSSETIV
ncbi:hypothetical protein CQ018_12565 [Arthrobacter sp. MYb227]|uniref:hypothetical protein n=1 Tax=Arthrobacter sp. MYb227 TaxID=1848601 RepID=UPI000CFCCF28|nr:hypothetical protein [Arthrobacter sp. MYb227]PQZ92328.1 hypothetical protein CQ018_12565 [Arthrobacter sp. MYb227]